MDKHIPEDLPFSSARGRYWLRYQGEGRADTGRTMDDIIGERVPVALIDWQGSPAHERDGIVYDFVMGRQRPVAEFLDMSGNYSHYVVFEHLRDVLTFVKQHYMNGLALLPSGLQPQ